MEQTKYLPVYFDNEAALRTLSDEDRGRLLLALLDHAQGREIPELSPAARIAFLLMASGIDRHAKRYTANVANGRKGGAPRGNQNACKTTEKQPNSTEEQAKTSEKQPTKTKTKTKDNDKNIKTTTKDKESIIAATRRFSPPAVEEIQAYCKERGNEVDPQRFFDFYESKGWRIGNQPMKDWKAAVRTWERRDTSIQGNRPNGPPGAAQTGNPFKRMLMEEMAKSEQT